MMYFRIQLDYHTINSSLFFLSFSLSPLSSPLILLSLSSLHLPHLSSSLLWCRPLPLIPYLPPFTFCLYLSLFSHSLFSHSLPPSPHSIQGRVEAVSHSSVSSSTSSPSPSPSDRPPGPPTPSSSCSTPTPAPTPPQTDTLASDRQAASKGLLDWLRQNPGYSMDLPAFAHVSTRRALSDHDGTSQKIIISCCSPVQLSLCSIGLSIV